MKTFEFWDVGRNKNWIEALLISIFHKHDYVFDRYPTKNSRQFICKECGRVRVFEYETPIKPLYRIYYKCANRPDGKMPHFGYYRSGDPNNINEKDYIIESVR